MSVHVIELGRREQQISCETILIAKSCKNCGAPMQSNKCEYCGTEYESAKVSQESDKE